MAIKKVLALYTGNVDELHTGDTLEGVTEGFSGLNNTGVQIDMGQPVYKTATTTEVALANATDDTKNCVGFASANISNGASGIILTGSTITIPDWTAISGAATLTPGTHYYLGTTAGTITSTVPSAAGNVVQRVGIAVSTTSLIILIGDRILLS